MNRRKLIRQLGTVGPGILLFPTLFSACRKEQLLSGQTFNGKVIIIGAGAAGLYAANLLRKHGAEVIILEASASSGGRIRANTTFADYPFELGADKLRGKRSIFYDLAAFHTPASLAPYSGTNYYLLDGVLRTEYFLKENAGLAGAGATLFQVLESFASYPGTEMTVAEYFNEISLEHRFLKIANALVGNDLGADNAALGMMAMKERASLSAAGNDQFFLNNRSYWSLFEMAFPDEFDLVQVNKVVKKITYSNQQTQVETLDGEIFKAARVLLTVPLGVLKNNDIQFDPPLPSAKATAIQKIGFGKGIRIALQFQQPFWADNTDLIMGGTLIPQYEVSSTGRSSAQFILSGTAMGEAAETLSAMTEQEAVAKIITELNQMYPGTGVNSKFSQQYLFQNWSNEHFFHGSFSYPSPGSEYQRSILAAPIANKVFFAGEASNDNGHSGTVNGAMESAYRAVLEILQS
ncbi:MAG: FAD-dependent oxidoreductase [Bacteroidia bacterium]|nr:FAD-dependent oxidoreductase [Bacteroidia bacterium]